MRMFARLLTGGVGNLLQQHADQFIETLAGDKKGREMGAEVLWDLRPHPPTRLRRLRTNFFLTEKGKRRSFRS